jgi:KaiC/GvpD/RAD55 family RecA-like ATPase
MKMTSEWLTEHRGITEETQEAFGVRVSPDEDAIIFPYPTGEKTRHFGLDGARKFVTPKGFKPSLFMPPPREYSAKSAFITEGESDAMRLWQELGGDRAVYGLGGVLTWSDEFSSILSRYDRVYVILDNDTDYNVQTQVTNGWLKVKKSLGRKARRVYLPQGVKDVCEFFHFGYDRSDLDLLVREVSTASRFKPLDLTIKPPPVDWLLEGYIAKGDFTLLSGGEGLGKSQITMALSVAIVEGKDTFLDRNVMAHGKVLYIDEENPVDVIYSRLRRYGLQAKNMPKLRYIWNNGVRLENQADALLDEALSFEPDLIVLDSLSRVHSGDENSMASMSPILNDAIKPLARETGAAVILIHHHDKGRTGPRGSGDIGATIDSGIDVFEGAAPGVMRLKLRKSRRRLTGEEMMVQIKDTEDGRLELATSDIADYQF